MQFAQPLQCRIHALDLNGRGTDHRAIVGPLALPPLAFLELRLRQPVGPFGEGARPMPARLAGTA